MENKIAAVILAAGLSTRMGQMKALLPIGELTTLEHSVNLFKNAGISKIYVVTGYQREELLELIQKLAVQSVEEIYNLNYKKGMFSSVQSVIQAMSRDYDAFFLLPVDIPLIELSTIKKMMAAFSLSAVKVIYPIYNGKRGHPPLISSELNDSIMNWDGTLGLRGLLSQYEDFSLSIEVGDAAILSDMDTPEDYLKILAAMQKKKEMSKMNKQHTPIGATLKRHDAPAKVRGMEKYAVDYYPEEMLWLGVKRSEHAHAIVKNINTKKAREIPSVYKVLTYENVKGSNRVGVPELDQPILVDKKVLYRGDAVALILAESKEAIFKICEAIEVEYEILPAVFDPAQALEENAPVLHEGRVEKNLLISGIINRGEVSQAFNQCVAVVEAEFSLPWQEHAYLETEAGVAVLSAEGILEITASTQTPFRDKFELSQALGFPMDKIRVIAPYLGGGFGGKDGISVQGFLGLAALNSEGRPVKMWNSREESFLSSTKRHPARVKYRLGCDADGVLQAMSCKIILDTGAYASLGAPVTSLAMEHAAGVYRIPNCLVEASCVYTNNPVGGAFRGFGAPQVLAGIEQMIDILADKINMDSLEIRLKNAVNRGDELGIGVRMTNSTGIIACLEMLKEHPLCAKRDEWVKEAPAFKKRGIGVAAGLQGTGYGPVVADIATAKVEFLADGRFKIYSGVSDMGQGNNPTNIHIAGEVLSQATKDFDLCQPDTFYSLPSGSSAASRTTYSYGNALKEACSLLKERILTRACNLIFGVRSEDLLLSSGKVTHIPTGKEIALAFIASTMSEAERFSIYAYTAPIALTNTNNPVAPDIRSAGFPHLVFSFAAHLARLEIDEISGEVSVCDYLACTDGGKVLNPQLYEQQIQGGIVQGMGYALWEDFKIIDGEIQSKNFTTYILPTSMDVPDIISLAVETLEETGPYGMKGIGEIGINLPLPAIANAITQAIRQRIFKAPLNAERILKAINISNKGDLRNED